VVGVGTYLTVYAVGGLACLGLAAWVGRIADSRADWLFVALLSADAVWVGVKAAALLGSDTLRYWLLHLSTAVGLTSVSLWVLFAVAYSRRPLSVRTPAVALVVGHYVFAVGALVTNPLHGRYWTAFVRHTEPFRYYETVPGVAWIASYTVLLLLLVVSLYYLGELFVKSRHRTSASTLVLLVGALLSMLPNLLTTAGVLPVDGYDHTGMGTVLFAVLSTVAVYGLGAIEIEPIARDDLLDHVSDAILVTDADRRIVDYNAASVDLPADRPVEEWIGTDLATVLPAVLDAVAVDGGCEDRGTVGIEGNGDRRHYSVLHSPVEERGDVVGHSFVLRDVTELRRYQAELERQNEQLESFASTVTHDLRNPLSVANGYVEDLAATVDREETVATDEIAPTVEAVEESHERMAAIVEDLRTLAKKGQSVESTEAVHFEAAVRDAWSNVATGDATLEITADGMIVADRSRLLSVLENLVRNAVDHAGPDVAVTAAVTDDGFVVADDGPGIPAEDADSVFEYGYTTHEDGTGLGLSIVRTMVESHGWSIVVDDAADGARFVVTGATTEPATSVAQTV